MDVAAGFLGRPAFCVLFETLKKSVLMDIVFFSVDIWFFVFFCWYKTQRKKTASFSASVASRSACRYAYT